MLLCPYNLDINSRSPIVCQFQASPIQDIVMTSNGIMPPPSLCVPFGIKTIQVNSTLEQSDNKGLVFLWVELTKGQKLFVCCLLAAVGVATLTDKHQSNRMLVWFFPT